MFRKAIHLAEVEAGETGQHGVDREELTIESYDVVQEEYPSEERVRLADGILITGSCKCSSSVSVPIFMIASACMNSFLRLRISTLDYSLDIIRRLLARS